MMMTLTQAAKATGKSKSTLLRAIKMGRLSGSQDENGVYMIDAAELHRVFTVSVDAPHDAPLARHATGDDALLLRNEVAMLRDQLERERTFNRQLSGLLDDERDERKRLTAMLTHQPASLTRHDAPSTIKGWGKTTWALLVVLGTVIVCSVIWLDWPPSKPLPPPSVSATQEPTRPVPKLDGEPWKPDHGG